MYEHSLLCGIMNDWYGSMEDLFQDLKHYGFEVLESNRESITVSCDDDGDYVCELWEASTRHPDVVYHMNADGKYKKSGLYDDDKYEVFQWLLSIAGDLTFRFHAYSLVQYALREWYQVDD